ncbi:AAA family ATPase [Cellulomonas sp. NPDC089187]|uniref:uridine kinase family protein n=1 Tax=Cellulomonas sp. NPDC089187 TaxID=3154970 RepID=UPI0034492598
MPIPVGTPSDATEPTASSRTVVADIAARVRAVGPTLGRTRLVLIDGPAGSGKTTLAAALATELHAQVVHMDDLYPGWSGLSAGVTRLHDEILLPLADGHPAEYRRYDWHTASLAEPHPVPVADVLIVEGCGSGSRRPARWSTLLIWVETTDDERLARGLARDGADARSHWLRWMAEERALYAAQDTAARADVHLDGHGQLRL